MRPPSIPARAEAGNEDAGVAAPVSPARALIGYFRRLWSGELPLSRVLWTDMLIIGTLVNIVALIASLVLFAAAAPLILSVAVFLLHIPYNILLLQGVWRSADREEPAWSWTARVIALVWFLVALLV
jgi:hypothetical protein